MKMIWFKLGVLLMAMSILYISLARASLERSIEDERLDNLRKVPIRFEEKTYRLPETRTLPDSPFYFFKQTRDELWVELTTDPTDKFRVVMLIADKRMEEALTLEKKNMNSPLVKKTIDDAVKKLEMAVEIVDKYNFNEIEKREMNWRMDQAVMAYKWIIDSTKINQEDKKIFFDKLNSIE